jgi:hypothetical protein
MSSLELAVDASKVTPGLLGFAVVALLGVGTYLLIRSMNRQIRRIDLPDEKADDPSGDEPGRVTGDDRPPV